MKGMQNAEGQMTNISDQSQNKKFLKIFTLDKTIGYILLTIGLLMIFVPVFMIYRVLSGAAKPMQVLNVEAPSIQLPNTNSSIEIPAQLKAQGFSLGQNSGPTSQKIIPDEVFNFYINAGIFYLLMVFITSAGSKIAIIGTKLIKEITFNKT